MSQNRGPVRVIRMEEGKDRSLWPVVPFAKDEEVPYPQIQTSSEKELEIQNLKAEGKENQMKVTDAPISEPEKGSGSLQPHAVVNEQACISCCICEGECPEGAITVEEFAVIDQKKCTGCGQCVDVCPEDAILLLNKKAPA